MLYFPSSQLQPALAELPVAINRTIVDEIINLRQFIAIQAQADLVAINRLQLIGTLLLCKGLLSQQTALIKDLLNASPPAANHVHKFLLITHCELNYFSKALLLGQVDIVRQLLFPNIVLKLGESNNQFFKEAILSENPQLVRYMLGFAPVLANLKDLSSSGLDYLFFKSTTSEKADPAYKQELFEILSTLPIAKKLLSEALDPLMLTACAVDKSVSQFDESFFQAPYFVNFMLNLAPLRFIAFNTATQLNALSYLAQCHQNATALESELSTLIRHFTLTYKLWPPLPTLVELALMAMLFSGFRGLRYTNFQKQNLIKQAILNFFNTADSNVFIFIINSSKFETQKQALVGYFLEVFLQHCSTPAQHIKFILFLRSPAIINHLNTHPTKFLNTIIATLNCQDFYKLQVIDFMLAQPKVRASLGVDNEALLQAVKLGQANILGKLLTCTEAIPQVGANNNQVLRQALACLAAAKEETISHQYKKIILTLSQFKANNTFNQAIDATAWQELLADYLGQAKQQLTEHPTSLDSLELNPDGGVNVDSVLAACQPLLLIKLEPEKSIAHEALGINVIKNLVQDYLINKQFNNYVSVFARLESYSLTTLAAIKDALTQLNVYHKPLAALTLTEQAYLQSLQPNSFQIQTLLNYCEKQFGQQLHTATADINYAGRAFNNYALLVHYFSKQLFTVYYPQIMQKITELQLNSVTPVLNNQANKHIQSQPVDAEPWLKRLKL